LLILVETLQTQIILLENWTLFKLNLPNPEAFRSQFTKLTGSDKLQFIRQSLVQLWVSVLDNRKPADVYQAVFDVYTAVDGVASQPSTPTTAKISGDEDEPHAADALLNHWKGEYIGHSRDILRKRIREYEQEGLKNYYSKSLLFLQSSGTGKSRLADAFGEICPMVSYVIRKDQFGFPPRDDEVLTFMQSDPSSGEKALMLSPVSEPDLTSGDRSERLSNIWFHAIAIGILQASFEVCKYFFLVPLGWDLLTPAYTVCR
jgi:hypothetical protein